MKLLRYIKGLRKGKDAHRIERDAMTDPFLSDALEGFDMVDGNHAERIERMQRRIGQLSQKENHRTAAKAAAKRAAIPINELMEESLSAEMYVAEEKAAIPILEAKPIEKKKRRSLAVWLAAAILLLFFATGGYFWLLKEEKTVAPQLAAAAESTTAGKDIATNEADDVQTDISSAEQETIPQNNQHNAINDKQQEQVVAAPITTIPPPPVIPHLDNIEEELALANAEIMTPKEIFDISRSRNTEIDSILSLNKLTVADSSTSSFFAFTEGEKPYAESSISAINTEELGIYSNTNRHALSQELPGSIAGIQTDKKKKSEAADPYALSQSQIYSQGKIGGKLAEQNLPTASRAEQRSGSTAAISSLPSANSGNIQGRVIDEHGVPLVGVTVMVKGSTTHTITDTEGYFALNAKNAEKIVASYIGFDNIELPVDTSRTMTIAMNESTAQLDEIVVVAYGRNINSDEYSFQSRITPEPEMGHSAYRKYLNDNMRIPADECANVKGRVVLTFNVNSSGRPYNIQVKRSLCPSADQEAIRLVEDGGLWTTGDGEVRLTIKF